MNYVLKMDGLCGGKGVVVCSSLDEMIKSINIFCEKNKFNKELKDEKILLEEKLIGIECTVMGFCNGKKVLLSDFEPELGVGSVASVCSHSSHLFLPVHLVAPSPK